MQLIRQRRRNLWLTVGLPPLEWATRVESSAKQQREGRADLTWVCTEGIVHACIGRPEMPRADIMISGNGVGITIYL